MRAQKGITLVALIITIIVLLILAIVTIATVTGDGIIDHATTATETYKNNAGLENDFIQGYVNFLNNEMPVVNE